MGRALRSPYHDRSSIDRDGHERSDHHDDREACGGPTMAKNGFQTTQHSME
jgi:hypothetical protein